MEEDEEIFFCWSHPLIRWRVGFYSGSGTRRAYSPPGPWGSEIMSANQATMEAFRDTEVFWWVLLRILSVSSKNSNSGGCREEWIINRIHYNSLQASKVTGFAVMPREETTLLFMIRSPLKPHGPFFFKPARLRRIFFSSSSSVYYFHVIQKNQAYHFIIWNVREKLWIDRVDPVYLFVRYGVPARETNRPPGSNTSAQNFWML